MSEEKPSFPIEEKIELQRGTTVSFYLPGTYTLEWGDEGPYLDVGYNIDFLTRGEMEHDEVEAAIKARVDQIMMPVMFTDPSVIAHLESTERPTEPKPFAKRRSFGRG